MNSETDPCLGMRFRFEGTEFEICFHDHELIRSATCAGGRQNFLTLSDWRLRVSSGRIVVTFIPLHVAEGNMPVTLANESEEKYRRRLQHYLRGLIAIFGWSWPSRNIVLEQVAKLATKLEDKKPPCYSTVCSWRALAWNEGLSNATGMPHFSERGAKSPYSPEEIAWIKRNSQALLKQKPRLSIADLRKDLVGLRLETNDCLFVETPFPSERTLHRIVGSIDPYVLEGLRRGKKAADRTFRAAGQSFETSRFLQLVFGDGHVLDVLVVPHLENGEIDVSLASIDGASYRPYLTRFMDCHCRYLFPGCISSIPFSTSTALEALKNVVIAETGEPRGIPEKGVLDNGGDYVSDGFKRAIAKLAFTFEYAEGEYPDAKAILERYFRDLNRFIHSLPGTTFSNPQDRGDFESGRLAILTLPQLAALIAEHEAIYCDDIHGTTGRAPRQMALEGVAAMPPRTLSPTEVDHVFRVPRRVVISKGRVKYKNLQWFSHALRTYEVSERRAGRKPWVTLLLNEFDLGDALVELSDEKRTVPKVNPNRPLFMKGLSLREYELICEEEKKAGKADVAKLSENELIRRRHALYKRLREEAEKNRRALRKHQRLLEGRARSERTDPPAAALPSGLPPTSAPKPAVKREEPRSTASAATSDSAEPDPAADEAPTEESGAPKGKGLPAPVTPPSAPPAGAKSSLEAFLSLSKRPIVALPTSSRGPEESK